MSSAELGADDVGNFNFPRGGGGGGGRGLKRIPVVGTGCGTSLKRRSFVGATVTLVYRSFSSFFVRGDSKTITNVSVIVAATSELSSWPSLWAVLIRISASDSERLLRSRLACSSPETLTASTVLERCRRFRGGACGTSSLLQSRVPHVESSNGLN